METGGEGNVLAEISRDLEAFELFLELYFYIMKQNKLTLK